MPTDEVKQSIRQLIKLKNNILLCGGISPFSKVYEDYEYQQRVVLQAFGLRKSFYSLKILNHPPLSFTYDDVPRMLDWGEEIQFDGSPLSTFKENGRQYLNSTRPVHLRNIEEQVEKMYNALNEKSKKLYGG